MCTSDRYITYSGVVERLSLAFDMLRACRNPSMFHPFLHTALAFLEALTADEKCGEPLTCVTVPFHRARGVGYGWLCCEPASGFLRATQVQVQARVRANGRNEPVSDRVSQHRHRWCVQSPVPLVDEHAIHPSSHRIVVRACWPLVHWRMLVWSHKGTDSGSSSGPCLDLHREGCFFRVFASRLAVAARDDAVV